MHGKCKVRLSLQQYHCAVICLVTDLSQGFGLTLGDTWLLKHDAHLDHARKVCIFCKGQRCITLRMQALIASKPLPRVLSAMQFKRAVSKGCGMFLMHLQKVELSEVVQQQEGEAGSQSEKLLEEYTDVFAILPDGLPPVRVVGRTIPVEPGARPPFRPMYRLSPSELGEAKIQLDEYL